MFLLAKYNLFPPPTIRLPYSSSSSSATALSSEISLVACASFQIFSSTEHVFSTIWEKLKGVASSDFLSQSVWPVVCYRTFSWPKNIYKFSCWRQDQVHCVRECVEKRRRWILFHIDFHSVQIKKLSHHGPQPSKRKDDKLKLIPWNITPAWCGCTQQYLDIQQRNFMLQ